MVLRMVELTWLVVAVFLIVKASSGKPTESRMSHPMQTGRRGPRPRVRPSAAHLLLRHVEASLCREAAFAHSNVNSYVYDAWCGS